MSGPKSIPIDVRCLLRYNFRVGYDGPRTQLYAHIRAYNPSIMRTIVSLALVLVVGGACSCKRSELDSFNSKWMKLPLSPLAGSYYLQQAKTSPCTWSVQTDGDRITIQRISITSPQRPPELRLRFAGGTLVGENHGEWGGSLSVLDNASRTPRTILSENILQMYLIREGVVVITGDLPSNEGSVWLYSNAEDHGWSIQKRAVLHGFPKVVGRSRERLLLAYGDAISIMDDFHERQITALPTLEVQPNSIAQDAKSDIYVGMNAFVLRLVSDRNHYSQQWFTQKECL
jgi:hypothetical protein